MAPKGIEEYAYLAVELGEIEIDECGRIWRLAARRGNGPGSTKLVPCKRRRTESPMSGYLAVRVMFEGKRYQALAHRMVYLHFHGAIPKNYTINHKNGNKLDNHPDNLEAITQSENATHAFRVIKTRKPVRVCKLTEQQVREIFQRRLNGENNVEIAQDFGICFQNVSSIFMGKIWRHLKLREAIK